GRRCRVRAVLAELDHLRAGDDRKKLLGALDLDRGGAGEVAAVPELPAHRLHDRRVGVAERHGAVAETVLDVLVAVRVPDMAAGPARDEARRKHRVLVVALGVGVAAAGYETVGTALQARRARVTRPAGHDLFVHLNRSGLETGSPI